MMTDVHALKAHLDAQRRKLDEARDNDNGDGDNGDSGVGDNGGVGDNQDDDDNSRANTTRPTSAPPVSPVAENTALLDMFRILREDDRQARRQDLCPVRTVDGTSPSIRPSNADVRQRAASGARPREAPTSERRLWFPRTRRGPGTLRVVVPLDVRMEYPQVLVPLDLTAIKPKYDGSAEALLRSFISAVE
eukprot:PhM_4_TR18805/c3_g6_i1/m.91500